jgi:HSP20 family protein
MAITDIVKRNGNGNGNTEQSNLPARREGYGYNLPAFPSMFEDPAEWMQRWDRTFDSLMSRAFGNMLPTTGNWGERWSNFTPAVNVAETDEEYRITAELPGMDEKDIELTLHKDHLLIKGEKKQEEEEQGQGYHRMERTYGVFQRHIPLPRQVDTDQADATFKDGVLTITLPKLSDVQTGAKKITIKGGGK